MPVLMPDIARILFLEYAEKFLSVPYRFGTAVGGGDDPILGMDCSGFVDESARSIGLIGGNERLSSKQMAERFRISEVDLESAPRGSLIFYKGSSGEIEHVAIKRNAWQIIEAGGGTRETDTPEEAAIRNAFVRVRPIRNRKADIVLVCDPIGKMLPQ